MFCAKLVDLCKTCKVNTVEPLQEVMFDPTKHATFESESAGKDSFTFRYVVTHPKPQPLISRPCRPCPHPGLFPCPRVVGYA